MKKARNVVQIKQEGISFKHNLSKADLELVEADIALTKTINKLAEIETEIMVERLDKEITDSFGIPEEYIGCQKPRTVLDPNPRS